MKLTYAIDIKNTPENVFRWIGNPDKAMEWQSSVSGGEIIDEKPGMIGTTFRETVEEDGRGTEMQGEITDWRENELIAMHLSGKYNTVDVEWRLDEVEGFTHVTGDFNIQFKSFLRILSIILWPAFKKKNLGQLQEEFARLKELCEQDT